MQIETEQDMIEFCEQANLSGKPFRVFINWTKNPRDYDSLNREMIKKGLIGLGSHLQQGISAFYFYGHSKLVQDISGFDFEDFQDVELGETPYLYPSVQLLQEHPELTGPMTGNLSNCYDPYTKRFLFHMRGKDISAPFGFQAASAGMGVYRQNPGLTSALELYQEAGLENFRQFFDGKAIDVLPFMKAGKIPQPLFSYGFEADISQFRVCNSLDDIAEFETETKQKLQSGTLQQKEAYHFTLPYKKVEEIAGELNDRNRFYGPIYDSTINFIRVLKDSGYLD